jgi:hypothetical protein
MSQQGRRKTARRPPHSSGPPTRAVQFIEEDASSEDSSTSEYSDNLSIVTEDTGATSCLSVSLKRQLAVDIATRGGIDTFSLRSLCKEKPDQYGKPRSKLRRQIQNKVGRWRRSYRSEYNDLVPGSPVTQFVAKASSAASPLSSPPSATQRVRTPASSSNQHYSSEKRLFASPSTNKNLPPTNSSSTQPVAAAMTVLHDYLREACDGK